MTQKQAALTSMGEYLQRANGLEQERREAWELTRWQIFHQYRLSPFIKHPPQKVTDVVTFPWEKTDKSRQITRKRARVTAAESEALSAIFKDYFNRKYNS